MPHRAKVVSALRKARPIIAATLPAQCVQPTCQLGGTVYPWQPWDVAHIIDDVHGGGVERSNLGPAHRRCNRSDGGKIGAARANAARKQRKGIRSWL